MSVSIVFPNNNIDSYNDKIRRIYYPMHMTFIKNILSYPSNNITLIEGKNAIIDKNNLAVFSIKINGRKIAIDFSNHLEMVKTRYPYFKFTVVESIKDKCYPLTPCSFLDWNLYEQLRNKITYQANPSDMLFYKTRYLDNPKYQKRLDVFNIIKSSQYKTKFDFKFNKSQNSYFESLSHCYLQVVVSGARPDTLDRTHMQLLALGIPFITTKMANILPNWVKLEPDVNYIECKMDYSNLEDRIEYALSNPSHLKEISKNNKELFFNNCTASAIQKWIFNNLNIKL